MSRRRRASPALPDLSELDARILALLTEVHDRDRAEFERMEREILRAIELSKRIGR